MSTTPAGRSPAAGATCRFTSINLPRIAIKAHGDVEWFFEELERKMDLVHRAAAGALQDPGCQERCDNYPFLMGQGVWLDSEKLGPDDTVGEVLKHGTLTIGFIGLAEMPQGAHRQAPRRERGGPEPGAGDRRLYAQAHVTRRAQKTGLNFSLHRHPGRGPLRPVCAHGPRRSTARSPV